MKKKGTIANYDRWGHDQIWRVPPSPYTTFKSCPVLDRLINQPNSGRQCYDVKTNAISSSFSKYWKKALQLIIRSFEKYVMWEIPTDQV